MSLTQWFLLILGAIVLFIGRRILSVLGDIGVEIRITQGEVAKLRRRVRTLGRSVRQGRAVQQVSSLGLNVNRACVCWTRDAVALSSCTHTTGFTDLDELHPIAMEP